MKIATMLLALCCISAVPLQSGPPSKGDIFLTLASHTVWQAQNKWCTFSAEIVHGIGSLSEECGGALLAGKGAGPSKRRTLSRAEAQKLRTLYDGARLFEAAAAGNDPRGSDLPFLILIVRAVDTSRSKSAIALVVSGNDSFSHGPRAVLVDWMLTERRALMQE